MSQLNDQTTQKQLLHTPTRTNPLAASVWRLQNELNEMTE